MTSRAPPSKSVCTVTLVCPRVSLADVIVNAVVRVRPPLDPNNPGFDLVPKRFRDSACEVPTPTSLSIQSPQGKKLFVFDHVFHEDTTQKGVWNYLQDSVASFVKGYNVSILAYGQSGSGKSYTMGTSGPEDQADGRVMGIVPRAAQSLFEKLEGTPHRQSGLPAPKRYSQALPSLITGARGMNGSGERNWTLKATYVEIYQEQLRDLLVDESIPVPDRAAVAIREDAKGRILITGLTQVDIHSVNDLLSALNFGSSIRQTDATNINARSSRSHAVLSLNLVQKKSDTSSTTGERPQNRPEPIAGAEGIVTLDSKLHFVDLAGSERLKNTGATGDRAKEGISINAGLASLGKVIAQLSSKQSGAHISYRDSKLTRLLQDSLGGNAITFMVACVTPTIFHLSETLNTVHYAQRARAIQSRPEIQQSREEGDKQAVIDRLRAEISFLRDQIRHSENSGGKNVGGDRSRPGLGKDTELESQLMDVQENYNTLSNRHAKLIAELSKAREGEGNAPVLDEAVGERAMERVKRSNSFAEAVEQMVLEYEKTIQSLESSLSKTRGSLSNTESVLMEKETRIAYMETIQQQLHSRIQKATDREQNSESYLQHLEERLQGTATGEERNATLVTELRKELARARESENSQEDYIATLEERLAEGELDQEMMQREIQRLGHVVERQRSIGRLDNLLGELDRVRPQEQEQQDLPTPTQQTTPPKVAMVNGHRESYDPFRPGTESQASSRPASSLYEDVPESVPEERSGAAGADDDHVAWDGSTPTPRVSHHGTSQNDLVADKLETVTQELFDLRSEHETVITDYDRLQQKYRTALETLARLEYHGGDGTAGATTGRRGIVSAFLAHEGVNGEQKGGAEERPSSSRSSLAEPSSQQPRNIYSSADSDPAPQTSDAQIEGGSDPAPQTSDAQIEGESDPAPQPNGVQIEGESDPAPQPNGAQIEGGSDPAPKPNGVQIEGGLDDQLDSEVEMLRRHHAEQKVSVAEITHIYQALQARHEATLGQVEDLKAELAKVQNARPHSPSVSKSFTIFRRKSEDSLSSPWDKASRSVTSLRNIARLQFGDNVDQQQSFEVSLNTVIAELQGRSERVQALEGEVVAIKKEMDNKQTIIAGLSRERASLRATSKMDFSVVGRMRDQLDESEKQIRALHEQHATKEREFQEQVESLKATVASHGFQFPAPAADDRQASPGVDDQQTSTGASDPDGQSQEIATLQGQLQGWERKHEDYVQSMQATESRLMRQIQEMEDALRSSSDAGSRERSPVSPPVGVSTASADALASIELERSKHKGVIDALQREVDEYKSTAGEHVGKLRQLETSYGAILRKVDDSAKDRDFDAKELEDHKELVANLESQLQVHKSAIKIHQDSLESLQTSHSNELEGLKASMVLAERESMARYTELETQHQETTRRLQTELTQAQTEKSELLRKASSVLGSETDSRTLHGQIQGLVEEGKELHGRHLKTTNELKAVQEELRKALTNTIDLEKRIEELKSINQETIANLEKVSEKERKSSRLVEELEEQLNTNFDSHRATTNRLSSMQGAVAQQMIDLERELEEQKMRNGMLEVSDIGCTADGPPTDRFSSAASNQQLQTPIRQLAQPRLALPRSRGHRRALRLVFVASRRPKIRRGHADAAPLHPPAAPSRQPCCAQRRQRRLLDRAPRHLARGRLAAELGPRLQGHWPPRFGAHRGAGGAHPRHREAPVCGEAANGDAGGGARRPRDQRKPHQERAGWLASQVRRPRRRARRPAPRKVHLARQPAGRRGGARNARARRARPPGPRAAHDGAQRRQEEEEGWPQLLLGAARGPAHPIQSRLSVYGTTSCCAAAPPELSLRFPARAVDSPLHAAPPSSHHDVSTSQRFSSAHSPPARIMTPAVPGAADADAHARTPALFLARARHQAFERPPPGRAARGGKTGVEE